MKKVHIKVTTANGKEICSVPVERKEHTVEAYESIIKSPGLSYLTLDTDSGKTFIPKGTFDNSVIEIITTD